MGPIGLMAAYYAFQKGASRVIGIDNNWRLQYGQSKLPKLEILDFSKIPSGSSVPTELRKMVDKGVDVALECAAGEYSKGILHKVEQTLGLETDTSEILNEMILSVKKFGKIGITGVYAGCAYLSSFLHALSRVFNIFGFPPSIAYICYCTRVY
jgi:threonine dehydrogenase-like Zn-dependent dehydrogenase